MILELKGIINIPKKTYCDEPCDVSLTCCCSVPQVMIGDVNLYDTLEELFSPDAEAEFEGKETVRKMMEVKYVVVDEIPSEEKSFNDLSADVINGMMSPEYVSGCYSEYTCGFGGFDYLINTHSIFSELKEHTSKYIHLII